MALTPRPASIGAAYADGVDSEDEWAAPAAAWDDDPAVRAYATAAYESLRSIVREHSIGLRGARVIDFGCGTGLLTERLVAAGAKVDAVDTSEAMLAVLREKNTRHPLPGVTTATVLPEATADHDLVVCSSVCSFVPDYPGTVVDLVARLRPGGVFVQWDWERSADDAHGLTRDEVRSALTAGGLSWIAVATGFEIEVDGQSMRPLVGRGRRPTDG